MEKRTQEARKKSLPRAHGPTGCIAQSIGPYDTIKDSGTDGRRHIGVNVLKSQRKELLPGIRIHRWRQRINVLSQKKSKSWITWPYRVVCLFRLSVCAAIMCGCRRRRLISSATCATHCSRPIVNDPAIQGRRRMGENLNPP